MLDLSLQATRWMLKKSMLAVLLVAGFTSAAFADVTIHVLNMDTSTRSFPVTCSDKKTSTLKIDRLLKTKMSFPGKGPCTIKFSGGQLVVKDGDPIKIRDNKVLKSDRSTM